MEKNLVKKGIRSIYGGLQMLSESKTESLSALAEISIILSDSSIRERYSLDDDITNFLSLIHFLLKDINQDSVKLINDFISSNELYKDEPILNIGYKQKYENTLVELTDLQGMYLKLKGL